MKRFARLVLGKSKRSPAPLPEATRPVSTVLFDFDGTLADTFADGLEILNDLAGQFGFRPLLGDDVERARDMTTRQLMRFLGVPGRKLPSLSHQGVKRLRSRIDRIGPFPGVDAMLRTLRDRGLRLGIVTSNSEENVSVFLKNHGIEYFEFVRSSSRLLGKARVIRQTMREFQFSVDETVFVGDETRDIEACRRVGMRCIAVTWGYNSIKALEAQHPHRVVHDLADLPDVIAKIRVE